MQRAIHRSVYHEGRLGATGGKVRRGERCRRRDSNSHGRSPPRPEHGVSANSTTSARVLPAKAGPSGKFRYQQREDEEGGRCTDRKLEKQALDAASRREDRFIATKDAAQTGSLGLEQDEPHQEDRQDSLHDVQCRGHDDTSRFTAGVPPDEWDYSTGPPAPQAHPERLTGGSRHPDDTTSRS